MSTTPTITPLGADAADDLPSVMRAAILGADGVVYSLNRPARHHDIIRYMAGLGHPTPINGYSNGGFILSDGSFAHRRRARDCAYLNGQLLPTAGKSHELTSEDVW